MEFKDTSAQLDDTAAELVERRGKGESRDDGLISFSGLGFILLNNLFNWILIKKLNKSECCPRGHHVVEKSQLACADVEFRNRNTLTVGTNFENEE